jgi:hypothetical protein
MYEYYPIKDQIVGAEKAVEEIKKGPADSDFWRTGVEVYVGSFPDVSGPNFVIDPKDEKGIDIFREFAIKIADHYKSLAQ